MAEDICRKCGASLSTTALNSKLAEKVCECCGRAVVITDLKANYCPDCLKQRNENTGSLGLRADQPVELTGLGKKYDGQYKIEKVDHSIGDSDYSTRYVERRKKENP
jgi:hypothetical protein